MLKIKTKCGKNKYQDLKKKKGILNKIRLYLFIILGSLRDIFKEEDKLEN
tara:strand:- start:113 stop:262 length:150 start_codon:yes stop_codon:yes gene_type:complete